MENKIRPVEDFRENAVNAAVFERILRGKNGSFVAWNVKLQISFKGKDDDEWQNRQLNIVENQLDDVINALTQARDEINKRKGESRQKKRGESPSISLPRSISKHISAQHW